MVEKLKCKVCTKYKERIIGRRNFSNKWIKGSDSIRTTNLVDHAKSAYPCHESSMQGRSSKYRSTYILLHISQLFNHLVLFQSKNARS